MLPTAHAQDVSPFINLFGRIIENSIVESRSRQLEKREELRKIVELQENLARLGMYNKRVDGIYGPGTDAAVRIFIKRYNIRGNTGLSETLVATRQVLASRSEDSRVAVEKETSRDITERGPAQSADIAVRKGVEPSQSNSNESGSSRSLIELGERSPIELGEPLSGAPKPNTPVANAPSDTPPSDTPPSDTAPSDTADGIRAQSAATSKPAPTYSQILDRYISLLEVEEQRVQRCELSELLLGPLKSQLDGQVENIIRDQAVLDDCTKPGEG